jgi:hypothetical protein
LRKDLVKHNVEVKASKLLDFPARKIYQPETELMAIEEDPEASIISY